MAQPGHRRHVSSTSSSRSSSKVAGSSRSSRPKYCADIALLTDHSAFICDPSNLQSLETADLVIQSVRKHLDSGCVCIPLPRARFTIANARLSLFFLRLGTFASSVADHEVAHCNQFFETVPTPDERSDNGHVTSSRQSKSGSRFDPNPLLQFVNVASHEALMQPLVQAIEEWESGLIDSDFKSSDAATLRIPEHLLTAFHVCHLYKLIVQQETCARLARIAAVKPNDVLTSHCMHLQVALSVADRELADRSVRLGSALASKIKATGETFETALFFLLKCDYEIRRGIFTSASTLSSFIASDYLKKVTVNRFYLKAFAVYMGSKYPADAIQPSIHFQYFVEAQESMYMLLKRWHRKVFDPISTEDKKDDLTDPLWFRYAAYDLFGKSFILYSRFNINCGTPLESEFYHNVFIKFCRQNCLLFWLCKILVMAAGIDRLTDRPEEAQHKVMNALSLVKRRKSGSVWLSQETGDSHETDASASDDFIVSKAPLTELESGSCLHAQHFSVFDLKKKTIDLLSGQTDAEDEFMPIMDYFSSEPEDVSIFELDVARLEALIELVKITIPVSVKRINTLNKIGITNNIRVSLSLIRDVVKRIERPSHEKVSLLFRESLENGRELISSRQRFDINSLYLQSYAALGQHGKALTFANSVMSKKLAQRIDCLEGYCSRVQFAEFCLAYAKLLSTSSKTRRLEYNPAQVAESYLTRSGVSDLQRSPSPVRLFRAVKGGPPPKAPKAKQPFKMDEMNEYFKQLGQEVAKERTVVRNEGPVPQSPVQLYKKFLEKTAMTPAKKHLLFENSSRSGQSRRQALKSLTDSQGTPGDMSEDGCEEPDECTYLLSMVNHMVADEDNYYSIAALLSRYLGCHPPVHIYRDLVSLMSDFHLRKGRVMESSYFFSERISTAFRYHAMKICNKRKSKKTTLKYFPATFEFGTSSSSELITKTLSDCPRGWRVLQIVMEEGNKPGPDLSLTRFQHGKLPVSLRICSDEWKHKRNFLHELQEIIELSNNSILNKDPKSFWSLRTSLDNRMRKLVAGVEKAWLGPFVGFMLGQLASDNYLKLVPAACRDVMRLAEDRDLCCNDEGILELLVESSPVLSEEEFCSGIGMLFSFDAHFLTACHQIVTDMAGKFSPEAGTRNIFTDNKTLPVGLMLGRGLELFPWESLPTSRDCRQEFFRIPSFRFLSAALDAFKRIPIYAKGANSNKTFYLLNPTNNLSKTEDKFRDKFGEQSGWKGCVGKAPEPRLLAEGLEKDDIYIFFGHGAGSTYYRSIPNHLEGVNVNTASLVIGCSSGRLRHDGKELEAFGIPYRFLLNGAPAYVGVLWDVTDLDIDAFADNMLARWMPQWNCKSQIGSRKEGVSLCRATAEARDACKLKYLIGAAPVVYGLPIYARKGTPVAE